MADETNGGPSIVKDLETIIEIDGETFKLSQLVDTLRQAGDLADELGNLRDFRNSATRFMRREGEPHQLAEAASKMLAGAGYSDQEIKKYVAEWTNSANEPEQEEQETQEETNVTDKNDPRYDQLANETRQMRLRLMQQEMQKGVVDAIDTNEEIAKMLFGLDKSRGREHATGAYQAIQDQVRKATLDRLYERRDKSGGQFSEDWIQEEAARAASDVAKSYSTVIGDLGQLGRTPETVTEADTIAAKPPVPAPEFKKGMDRSTVDTTVREFNTDALTRLALDISAGGETKA